MAQDDFEQFRHQVLQDLRLQERLRDIRDREMFIQELVSLGQEQGYSFGVEEITLALQASRRAWIERGLG
jgi:hypothetical protein